jgi:hypothetical protein
MTLRNLSSPAHEALVVLGDALALSHVPRWAIVPTTRVQSVSDHSYRVGWIAVTILKLTGMWTRELAQQVMVMAVAHDLSESHSGDIPTPFKRAMVGSGGDYHIATKEAFAGAPIIARHTLTMADRIEAVTWLERWGASGGPNVESQATRVAGSIHRSLVEFIDTLAPYRHEFMYAYEMVIAAIREDYGRFDRRKPQPPQPPQSPDIAPAGENR